MKVCRDGRAVGLHSEQLLIVRFFRRAPFYKGCLAEASMKEAGIIYGRYQKKRYL